MRARPSRQARLERQRRLQARRRARGVAFAVILGAVLLVTLLLTAFASSDKRTVQTAAPAPAQRLLPTGPPSPQVIALQGAAAHPAPGATGAADGDRRVRDGDAALQLLTARHEGEPGLHHAHVPPRLRRRRRPRAALLLPRRGEPGNTALDVGAAAGTDVYAPVDGNVVGLTPYVINGRKVGAKIDIQPLADPATVVSISSCAPTRHSRSATRSPRHVEIGTVADLAKIEQQALARFTTDAGNGVTIAVYPAATLSIP